MICPRCEGQKYDRSSCSLCGNLGYLDADGGRISGNAQTPWEFVQDEGDFRRSVARALNARNELVFEGRPCDVALAVAAVNAAARETERGAHRASRPASVGGEPRPRVAPPAESPAGPEEER